jgi:tRNA(fMet)-specific endonuclease VapC
MDTPSVGVVLDSSILIAGERRGESVAQVLERVQAICGPQATALSAATAAELIHGIYRAKTDADRKRRQSFVEEVFLAVAVYPLTLEVARLAGRIHGEQGGQGIAIDFPDLVIGTTAIYLGFDVMTHNLKHFRLIPGLNVIQA